MIDLYEDIEEQVLNDLFTCKFNNWNEFKKYYDNKSYREDKNKYEKLAYIQEKKQELTKLIEYENLTKNL